MCIRDSPYFYVPFPQHYAQDSLLALELRTAGDPAGMIPEAVSYTHLDVYKRQLRNHSYHSGLLGAQCLHRFHPHRPSRRNVARHHSDRRQRR